MATKDGSSAQSIAGSLSKIKEISDYQKALCENLTKNIKQIDERLIELNPGVEAKVEVPHLENNGGDDPLTSILTDFIGFHRGPKGWRLYYFRQHNEKKKLVYYQLLTESLKEFQIRAVEQLPGLIEQIAERSESKTDEIKSSLDLAEAIAHSLA